MNSHMQAGTLVQEHEVLNLLSSLVSKSLIVYDSSTIGGGRYSLSESMRDYSREVLSRSGEANLARDRHRDYYLSLAESPELNSAGPEQAHRMAQLEIDLDNIYAAVNWSNQGANQSDRSARMVRAVWRFWF